MSDFLLIAPEGWSQLDLNAVTQFGDLTVGNIETWIQQNLLYELNDRLHQFGIIDAALTVNEAKIIDGTYFLVRLG